MGSGAVPKFCVSNELSGEAKAGPQTAPGIAGVMAITACVHLGGLQGVQTCAEILF